MYVDKSLFLKNKPGKPPFIGIAYVNDGGGFATLNHQDLPNTKREVTILLDVMIDYVDITILLRGDHYIRSYTNVAYNRSELDMWIVAAQHAEIINFGHVSLKKGAYILAKTFAHNTPFFFPVQRLYIFNLMNSKAIRAIY